MNRAEVNTSCPYCWEPLVILVEPSDVDNEYVEDCQVCCRPMLVWASIDEQGEYQAMTRREDD
ncbi:MAG: CPXCG motif-containing cysteine-rich protein [Pseudomonadota bacterium]